MTPQCFRLGELREAIQAMIRAGSISTDESGAMEWADHQVLLVPGSPVNLKITHPSDLQLARCLLGS
jgi:2-C-methyl-D-erythritol 4-phosphate cytidylyltransferase